MSVCYRLYELIFHIGIAKKVKPFVDEAKKAIAEMEAKTKSEKTAMAKATKEMNKKKAEMEKQASRDFQEKFEGPQGGGLRCFHLEPRKGGNSVTSIYLF